MLACCEEMMKFSSSLRAGARRDEHEAAAVSLASEEAAQKVDADLAAMRVQLQVRFLPEDIFQP